MIKCYDNVKSYMFTFSTDEKIQEILTKCNISKILFWNSITYIIITLTSKHYIIITWNSISIGLMHFKLKGPFTNYVTHFHLFLTTHLPIVTLWPYFYQWPTILTNVSNSNAFANHPPTPILLRNLWTAPNLINHPKNR